jgi:hypothetical protein
MLAIMGNLIDHDFFPYTEALIWIDENYPGKAFTEKQPTWVLDGWLYSRNDHYEKAEGHFTWWNGKDTIEVEWDAASHNCICDRPVKHCKCYDKDCDIEGARKFTKEEFKAALATRKFYRRWEMKDGSGFTFRCGCGCLDFFRRQSSLSWTFFEGSFLCGSCRKEHNYMSDSFRKYEKPTLFSTADQMTMF